MLNSNFFNAECWIFFIQHLKLKKLTYYIPKIYNNNKSEHKKEADCDEAFHNLVAYFASGDYFPEEKDNITAVESGNR